VSDPFEILREELVSAAERAAAVSPVSPRRRWRWLPTAVPILATATVAVGVAVVAFTIGTHAHGSPAITTSTSTIQHRGSNPAQAGRVRFLAVRRLASGELSAGQTFDIVGERYRWQGHVYFALSPRINLPNTGDITAAQNGVLAWTYSFGCPHPHGVLVAGLLRNPAATVVAREGNATTVLRHVLIPPVLHAGGGELVYAVLPRPPRELIVQQPDNWRVRTDILRDHARMCSQPHLTH
jgi:hypothetical protein